MSDIRIEPVEAPTTLQGPSATRFLAYVDVLNRAAEHDVGHPDLFEEPSEVWGMWTTGTDVKVAGFVALDGGVVVGVARVRYNVGDEATVDVEIATDPEVDARDSAALLLDAVERFASSLGRTIVQAWTLHPGGVIAEPFAPSTGFGAVPADAPLVRLHRDHGYSLEQVERTSSFDLHGSVDLVERHLAEAIAVAGPDYRVISWTGPVSDEWVDGMAHILSRMSTDAPQGGLTVEEQSFDAARVRRRDERLAAQELLVSTVAAVHEPTQTIAAYNELVIGPDRTLSTQQYGTLVLREHRGHRLGQLVKCAGILRWRELVPESPRVTTFNAEENRPMLAINEALGFVPVSYAGGWKKVLSPRGEHAGSAGRNDSSGS